MYRLFRSLHRKGIIPLVCLTAYLFCGATAPQTCQNQSNTSIGVSKGEVVGAIVGVVGGIGLEDDLTATAPCSDIIKNSVASPTISGPKISSTFKPNFGYSVPQAAVLCGFVDFDWVQTIAHLPDPNPFSALNLTVAPTTGVVNGTSIPIRLGGAFKSSITGPVKLTGASAPFNDPVQGGGYTYNSASPDYSFPFYCNVLGDGACPKTATTLAISDTPSNACMVDAAGNPSAGYLGSSKLQALCGNTTAPVGSYVSFTTHLAGVKSDGTAKDLGLGYAWKSTYNGTAGGVNTLKSTATPDPNSGSGGATLISLNEDTNYQYASIGVSGINGTSTTQSLLRGDQIAVVASGLAYSRVTRLFRGTVTITNTTDSPLSGPFQLTFSFLDRTITMPNSTGTFAGDPYITLPNGLAAGQSATVDVQFSNPSNAVINFSPIVFMGSFN